MSGHHAAGATRTARYIAEMANFLRWRASLSLVLLLGSSGACMDRDSSQKMAQVLQVGASRPDEIPRPLNLPFHYPAALYARRVQGNVTLYLHVDRNGQVRPDSTRIEESSGYAALDSAAVKGSQELQFVPAKLRGEPMGVSIHFPVYFRHPEANALPGDTILRTTPVRTRSAPSEGRDP